jgi:hypothetical protein
VLLAVISAFAPTAVLAQIVSCNGHELGHALVATALGWEVERVNLCLPAGGSVDYAHIGTWAGNAQGYAGGAIGGAILALAYGATCERRRLPYRSPGWWAAGLGIVLWIGPQLLIAVLEGSAGRGDDYTDAFSEAPALLLPLVGSALAAGPAVFLWRWRAVLRSRIQVDERPGRGQGPPD